MKEGEALRVMGLALASVFCTGAGLVSAAESCAANFSFFLDQPGSM